MYEVNHNILMTEVSCRVLIYIIYFMGVPKLIWEILTLKEEGDNKF